METWEYDEKMECRKWAHEIPYIQFPSEWKIKIIPPFGGASVRFIAKLNDKEVSIYLDCYGNLGCMASPYWEIYPNFEGDNERFGLDEVEEMLESIRLALLNDMPERRVIEPNT